MTISLAIDARPLARGTGGIQRYLKNLLSDLNNDDAFELILYSDHPIDCSFLVNKNKLRIRHIGNNFYPSIAWHLMVCLWAAKDKPSLFWSPRHHLPFILPKATERIVTIHDFVWKTWPKTMPKLQLYSEALLMPFSLKSADQIITISKTTQSQLRQFFPQHLPKSSVILHGVSISAPPTSARISGGHDYFLAVGTLEPRKNYKRLILAFDQYVINGGTKNLIIVGKNGWGYAPILESLKRSTNAHRIEILNSVTDIKLSQLYSQASGFVSPSLDEGYGLPPQEAKHHGLPLLLSDIDVYRELYPNANLWANPLSIDELASGLQELEKLPKNDIINQPKNDHSWADCAKMHTDVFLNSLQSNDLDLQ